MSLTWLVYAHAYTHCLFFGWIFAACLRASTFPKGSARNFDEDEKKALSGVGLNSIPTYSDRKAVYISESGLFISLGEFSKTPSDGTCLREPPGGVCDVGCCF